MRWIRAATSWGSDGLAALFVPLDVTAASFSAWRAVVTAAADTFEDGVVVG